MNVRSQMKLTFNNRINHLGPTNTSLESRDTSTECTPDSNGTSTIKRITISIIHRRKSYKVTSSTSSIQIWSIRAQLRLTSSRIVQKVKISRSFDSSPVHHMRISHLRSWIENGTIRIRVDLEINFIITYYSSGSTLNEWGIGDRAALLVSLFFWHFHVQIFPFCYCIE